MTEHTDQGDTTMDDPLIKALLAEREAGQPDKPEYRVGHSGDGSKHYVGVDRIATGHDGQPGFDCPRTALSGSRRYMVVWPASLTTWIVGTLGAYLTDDEWERAGEEREYAIEERSEE